MTIALSFKDKVKTEMRSRLSERQVQTVKLAYNHTIAAGLTVRGSVRRVGYSGGSGLENLYHGSIQKTGSTWLAALLSDRRISCYTGLHTFPQFRYEWGDFRKRFPRFTYVPGLYIPYGLYEEIKKPANFATIYVVRDPREVLVSWYYSTRDTHSLMGKVIKDRPILKGLDTEQGLRYAIQQLQLKFAFMRSWVYAAETDPNVRLYKFEELTKKPIVVVPKLLADLGIAVPTELVREVVEDYSFDRMRQRDIKTRNRSGNSHYRTDKKTWREVLSTANLDYFYRNVGDLVDILGYDY